MASTRGRYMKDYLAAVRRLPPSKHDAVLEGLSSVVEQIEAAANLEWLPVSVNLALTDAVFRELGDDQAELFFRNWLKRQMGAPPFDGMVRTALTLFGFDTLALAKWIPKAFDLMYRNYGTFLIEELGPRRLRLMPPELIAHRNWQRSVCAGMHAPFFLTGVQGTSELEPPDAERRALRIVLAWT